MPWMRGCIALAGIAALSGCVNPNRIAAAPVPTEAYRGLNCEEIDAERDKLQGHAPALFRAIRDGQRRWIPDYARLKGQYLALKRTSEAKNCEYSILFIDYDSYDPERCDECV